MVPLSLSKNVVRKIDIIPHTLINRTNYNHNRLFTSLISRCISSTSSNNNEGLGHTTILLQDGIDIEELPMIVRRISGQNISNFFNLKNKLPPSTQNEPDIIPDKEELDCIIEGFNNCNSIEEILKLLEAVPTSYVTSNVALQMLRKVSQLNDGKFQIGEEEEDENFTKTAVFTKLIHLVINTNDYNVLLECLKISNRNISFRLLFQNYRNKLQDQIILHASEGQYSIEDICVIIKELNYFHKNENCDKLWTGITDKKNEINESNIMGIFNVITYLKSSRTIVANLLSKIISSIWWKLSGNMVAEILAIIEETKCCNSSGEILRILARWFNTNTHKITEDEFLKIINGFKILNFHNSEIQRAIERYVKTKEIKNSTVIGSVMNFCMKFQVRSKIIFNVCEKYLTNNYESLSPIVIKALFQSFGFLSYEPENGKLFWKIIENTLNDKFVTFSPSDMIDMMLTCVYLKKYPINFTDKIFNPYFIEKLQSENSEQQWIINKTKLKKLDISMTLNCNNSKYKGPLLPKNYLDKKAIIYRDQRISTLINQINHIFLSFVNGSMDRIEYFVVPPHNLFPNDDSIYNVDVLLAPKTSYGSFIRYNFGNSNNKYTAILIHTPDHYTSDGLYLIGPQISKENDLKKAGIKVVSLEYLHMSMICDNRHEIDKYIRDKFDEAED